MHLKERRNVEARAALLRRIADDIIHNPSVTLTAETMRMWLGIPIDGAERILQRLAASGLLRELQKGMWAPSNWLAAH